MALGRTMLVDPFILLHFMVVKLDVALHFIFVQVNLI